MTKEEVRAKLASLWDAATWSMRFTFCRGIGYDGVASNRLAEEESWSAIDVADQNAIVAKAYERQDNLVLLEG